MFKKVKDMKKILIMMVAMVALASCGSRATKVQEPEALVDSLATEVVDSTVAVDTVVDTVVAE